LDRRSKGLPGIARPVRLGPVIVGFTVVADRNSPGPNTHRMQRGAGATAHGPMVGSGRRLRPGSTPRLRPSFSLKPRVSCSPSRRAPAPPAHEGAVSLIMSNTCPDDCASCIFTQVRAVSLQVLKTAGSVITTFGHLPASPGVEPWVLPTLLTDVLTTTLDQLGRPWNEQPCEQGRSDPLDGRGRL
jgi:hypothetical protein